MPNHNFPGSGKTFIPLENNPEVMTSLAHSLGVSSDLSFHDVYSLTDPDLLALIPRPCHALLFVYPITPSSESFHTTSQSAHPLYTSSGPDLPIFWIPQTINHACGLMGLIYAVSNPPSENTIRPNTTLSRFLDSTIPLTPGKRAAFLVNSAEIAAAHAQAAGQGDTTAPPLGEDPGHAYVTFVKGDDGHLYELEGRANGPIDRGELKDDEDVLCQKALELGPLKFFEREKDAVGQGVVRFSCTALAKSSDVK